MYNSKVYTKNNTARDKLYGMILLTVSVLVVSFLILFLINAYEDTTLVGKWISEETGTTITFTKDEQVHISASPLTGTYHIISPNTMEYTIDNLSFTMYYRIEDKSLYWGVTEAAAECFNRKQSFILE